MAAFAERPLLNFVDGTLGAGGHSAALLAQHPSMRNLVGIDKDPAAHLIARDRLQSVKAAQQSRVQIHHMQVCDKTYAYPVPALFTQGGMRQHPYVERLR